MSKLSDELIDFILNENKILGQLALKSITLNKTNLFKEIIKKTNKVNFNKAMNYAAQYGHIDVVKLCIKNGANNFNDAMNCAAQNGHIDIIKLMIQYGANTFNWAMYCAAHYNHIDIVKLCIKNGANNFEMAIKLSTECGHKEIEQLLKQQQRKIYGKNN